jgi:hypothetical protein
MARSSACPVLPEEHVSRLDMQAAVAAAAEKHMTVFHAVPNSRARPTYSKISNDNFRKLMDL